MNNIASPQSHTTHKPPLQRFKTLVVYTNERSDQARKFLMHSAIKGTQLCAYRIEKERVLADTSDIPLTRFDRLVPSFFLKKAGLASPRNHAIVLFTENRFLLKTIEKLASYNILLYWGNLKPKKAQLHFAPQSEDNDSVTSFIHCIQKVKF